MEFLKKSWKWILGVIGFFIGLVWMMNTNSSKKVKKIKRDIRSNENKTSEVDGKIKYIKKKKKVTKKKIADTKLMNMLIYITDYLRQVIESGNRFAASHFFILLV